MMADRRLSKEAPLEPTWHDGLSRTALVELVEGLLLAMDKAVSRLDADSCNTVPDFRRRCAVARPEPLP
jgi:hypothetical protein